MGGVYVLRAESASRTISGALIRGNPAHAHTIMWSPDGETDESALSLPTTGGPTILGRNRGAGNRTRRRGRHRLKSPDRWPGRDRASSPSGAGTYGDIGVHSYYANYEL
ncbi:cytochrome c biogenesis protein CycX-like protein [Anopheles sinensis]|uniref:Cytochrome c biogenesis protein CycX-like protein n=1 Tax=Anopheles sinensis TaxID=74873 RepID=A0A084VJ35_ANOSI|nr:cytochrome c biogenesis protein CycX-like protein [Anopheles sinensis]